MNKMFTSLKYVMAAAALLLSANVMADEISWTGQSDWSGIGEAEIELATDVYSVFCVKNNGSTNPTVNGNANDLRVYAKGTLRILTEKTMTAIVFKISTQGQKRLTDITASTGTVTIDKSAWTVTWTGSASDVTFTVGEKATYGTDGDSKAGQFDIDSPIQVTTSDDGVFVPAPVITPATGTYTEPQTVTITAQDGCEIWVSKQIGASFEKYTAPFIVSEDATITAYAVDATGAQSTTVTVAYTFVSTSDITGDGTAQNPYTVADVQALFATGTYPSDKVYVKGKISEIKSLDVNQFTRAQYYISDDGTTTNQFYIYNGLYLGGENFTANDQISVGDEVVVYGQLTIFGTTQEMAANNYIFSLNGQGGVVVEPDRYETISAAAAAATDTHKEAYIAVSNVVVTYINGSNVYVLETSTGCGFLLYGTNGLPEDLKVGDVLQGTLFGDLYTWNGLPELVPSSNNTALKVSENMTIEANTVELSDLLADPASNVSLLVKVESFMIDGTALTDKKVNINQYGDEAVMFDQFQVLTGVTFDPDAEYTATFITTVRDGVLQLCPINRDELLVKYEYEGEGTQEVPYTLADVQHLWVPKQPSNPVWVRGIIIGCVDGKFTEDKFSTTGIYPGAGKDGADKEVKSNIIIAPVENASKARKAEAGGYELSDCVPVALAAGSPLRDKLNIVDNPANVGKEVLLLGTIEDYFNIAGVKNLEDAIIDGTSLGVNGIAMDKEVLSGDIYTLAGQKVNAITRGGLYIIGGKKVFVK